MTFFFFFGWYAATTIQIAIVMRVIITEFHFTPCFSSVCADHEVLYLVSVIRIQGISSHVFLLIVEITYLIPIYLGAV